MENNTEFVSEVMSQLNKLDPDVTRRNEYMNKRDRYVYQSGLYEDLDIEGWFAEYNYLPRVVDIHTAQLMGRPFSVYSYYDKEDLGPYENDEGQLQLAELRNKKAKANADMRKKAIDAIIRDNGGDQLYKDGARLGSAYGVTAYKQWFDKKEKKIRQVLIESPQNLYVAWSDNNFREYDFCAYIHQISADSAYRDYGSKLAEGDMFNLSKEGEPLTPNSGITKDPLSQSAAHNDGKDQETDREMVTVVDLSGFVPGHAVKNGKIIDVKRGDEKRMSVMIVGGQVVQVIGDEKLIPKYYIIDNRRDPRRAWGASDIPDSALDINKEIVQLESDAITWSNKNTFKLIQAKGFVPESIPKKKPRKMQVVAMAAEQSLEEMQVSSQPLQDLRSLIQAKVEAFVRVTGVGRVLFDDPTVSANSNQALMTMMKPVIDIVEDKQSRWTPVLAEMFTDALNLSAQFIDELKDAVETDEGWYLCIEWPSVLRREDPAYQQLWLNRFINNTVSLETYLQKMGDPDTQEEVDRIRDEIKDPVTAAILAKSLGEVAHQTLNKSLGIPPWGYVVPKVNVRGDLSPQEMGNIAHNYQWDQGPYGPAIGPQGFQGAQANQDYQNTGFLSGADNTMQANYQGPQQQQNPSPQMTPDQNNPGVPSVAGSGRPQAVSPEGAIAQNNQRVGG